MTSLRSRSLPAWAEGAALFSVAVATVVGPFAASAQPSPGLPAPTAQPSAATSAAAGVVPPKTLPFFGHDLPSDKASPKPTPDEWRTALEVAPSRRGPRANGCTLARVREWIRVSCPEMVTATIAVLGGTATDYAFWIDPVKEGKDAKLPIGGEIQFPVRKGERRVVQILTFGPGYEGPLTQLPALVVQSHWSADASLPTLTML